MTDSGKQRPRRAFSADDSQPDGVDDTRSGHAGRARRGATDDIDEYFGANAPLVVAEIELPAEDTPFERPSWLGREITADGRYTNAYLSKHPYSDWTPQEREA